MRRLLAVLLLSGPVLVAAPAQGRPDPAPRPVLNGSFADPAVISTPQGLVGFATGDRTPRAWARTESGRWRMERRALDRLPDWAAAKGDVWAVDIARVQNQYVLYFAAPAPGIVSQGRCIGVAVSSDPRHGFVNVGDRPLVCPKYADTPPAEDQLLPRDPTLPRAGVIDPSFFTDADGQNYLLYKTDRIPSSVRIVALTPDGLHVNPGATSVELFRVAGVFENPTLIRRPQGYVMLVSKGDWTKCEYRTEWLRSPTLLDWRVIESGTVLSRRTTGLCGPGGADFVEVAGKRQLRVFFHGWTCYRRPEPCKGRTQKWDHNQRRYHGIRALYGVRIRWPNGIPRIAGWL